MNTDKSGFRRIMKNVPAWIRRYSDSVILSPDFESGRRISEILRSAQDDKLKGIQDDKARRAQDARRGSRHRWLLILLILPFLLTCAASTDWNNPCDKEGSDYSLTECAKKQQSAGSQCEWCGRVISDSNATPLVGATVTLNFFNAGSENRTLVIAESDGSGCIDFSFDTSNVLYSVTVTFAGYQDYTTGSQTWGCHPGEKEIRMSPVSPGAPSAPSVLTAAGGASFSLVDLVWQDNSNNEDGFKLERKTGSGGTYSEITTVVVGVTSYQDSGLTCETMYYYRVRAYNSAGDSSYSSEANVTTGICSGTVPTAPTAPSGLTATVVSSTQINLYWVDNSNNEDGFLLERKTGAGGTYTEIKATGSNITYFPDNGLSAGTSYYYRVRAYNSIGNSVYSSEVYATTSSGANSPPVFILKWGSLGSGDAQFNEPGGLAVDSAGNIYVGDSQNSRVQKFSSSGPFITKWGSSGSGDGQFNLSGGVAIGLANTVYVADQLNYRIQRFSYSGTFISKWGSRGSGDGQFDYFYSIAADKYGNIYVADRGNYRIQKFDANEKFITKWGSQGSADGQFNFPSAITVSTDGYVYVSDYSNNRIQKFTSDGLFLTKWGSYGSGDGQFGGSSNGVAVDSAGNVYVVDSGNNRIQKFTSDGVFLTKWGSSGSGDGQFSSPVGIAIDHSDNIYVSEFGNDRIQKFGY